MFLKDPFDFFVEDIFRDLEMPYTKFFSNSDIPYRLYSDDKNYYVDVITPVNENYLKVKVDKNILYINVSIPKLSEKEYKIMKDFMKDYTLSFELNESEIDIDNIKVSFKDFLHIILPKSKTQKTKFIPIESERKEKAIKGDK